VGATGDVGAVAVMIAKSKQRTQPLPVTQRWRRHGHLKAELRPSRTIAGFREHAVIEFNVEAMSCSHCVSVVTQAVRSVDPNARVDVDLAAHKVRVESNEERAALAAALDEAGYTPS
jgi:copper chaperone